MEVAALSWSMIFMVPGRSVSSARAFPAFSAIFSHCLFHSAIVAVEIVPEGGTVLDCFMGSGSTGVACIKTGRRFIGIELNEIYYETAVRRIEEETSQVTLFSGGGI